MSGSSSIAVKAVVTGVIFVFAAWWLYEVSTRLGTPPVVDDSGNVVLDEYQRAKDILLVILPLLTSAAGYWLGAQGKEKAEAKADKAKEETKALVAVSTEPDLLSRAREQYPTAFDR